MAAIRGKSVARRGAQVLLLLALVLGVTELLVRLFLPPPQRVEVEANPDLEKRLARENQNPRVASIEKFANNEKFFLDTPTGRRLRAHCVVTVHDHAISGRTVELRTNSLGYRNPEIGPKTERPRVLFLGDSITISDYLDESETFVRRIQVLSEAEGFPLETVNAGIGSVGLDNELAILLETGLSIEPDVVVVGFYLNDVQASRGVRPRTLPAVLDWSSLAHHLLGGRSGAVTGALDEATLERWRAATAERLPAAPGDPRTQEAAFHQEILESLDDWGSAWCLEAWERMRPAFEELGRQSRLHGFRLFLLAFPHRDQVMAEFLCNDPQRTLAGIAAELDVPLLDLLPLLREEFRRTSSPLYYDWCHYTEYGNERLARWILDFLRSELEGPS